MAWIPIQYPNFPTNDPLLNAITSLDGQEMTEVRQAFYTTLLNSTLLMAEESGEHRPILRVDQSKQVILPVFTNLERLRRVFPDARRAGAMPVRDLCRMALKYGIHSININPEHGPGGYLDQNEIDALAEGIIPDLSSK